MKKIITTLLATLLIFNTTCANKPAQLNTTKAKLGRAAAMVIGDAAWYSTAFLMFGYCFHAQFNAETYLKWGLAFGALCGAYRGTKQFSQDEGKIIHITLPNQETMMITTTNPHATIEITAHYKKEKQ
jgi:hypothetical protein